MHATMARAASAYTQVQVTSRSPAELVVMLYDGAVSSLTQAREAMRARDYVTKRSAIDRAFAIVTHLQSTLDMQQGGEVAESLDRLYTYVIDQIVVANTSLSPGALDNCVRVLLPLRDAWAALSAQQDPDAP